MNSLKNLAKFCNENLKTNFNLEHVVVESGSADMFNYPAPTEIYTGWYTLSLHDALPISRPTISHQEAPIVAWSHKMHKADNIASRGSNRSVVA